MKALLLAAALMPLAVSAAPAIDVAGLDAAARVPWPLLNPSQEQALIANRARLDEAARREWALDRALPMLAGELKVTDEVVRDVLAEVARTARDAPASRQDMQAVAEARAAYAARDLSVAAARYAEVAKGSPLWPDALRERAWTLLLLDRPGDALGATVSLKAPYFAVKDHAEGRLMKATVLLGKCRYEEARTEIAALADAPLQSLSADAARQAVETNVVPAVAGAALAWNAPLVARVRAALAGRPDDAAVQARLVPLGARLLVSAYQAQANDIRDAKERALAIRYESLRAERRLLEQGFTLAKPQPSPLPPLDDDQVAWSFDGTFWRDELGNYRYTAGDACPRGAKP